MNRTFRSSDMKGEEIVKDYLIRYFYDRIKNNNILKQIVDYDSINDYQQQLQGIDTRLYCKNGKELIIDEKCALTYINKNLPTFAFEIQWNREGVITDGWLINNQLKTQYYFIMWLTGKEKRNVVKVYDYINQMTVDDLTSIELYAVNKRSLLKHLSNIGLTIEKMKEQAAFLVKSNQDKYKVNSDIKYVYSYKLAEQPVNLVIHKRLLSEIADSRFEITPNQVKQNGRIIYEE